MSSVMTKQEFQLLVHENFDTAREMIESAEYRAMTPRQKRNSGKRRQEIPPWEIAKLATLIVTGMVVRNQK